MDKKGARNYEKNRTVSRRSKTSFKDMGYALDSLNHFGNIQVVF
jgi:hypothetical protein